MKSIIDKTYELKKKWEKARVHNHDLKPFQEKARLLEEKLFVWVENTTDWANPNPFKAPAWCSEVDSTKLTLIRIQQCE